MEEFAQGMSDVIRAVRPSDLDVICEHRERMFAASGRERASLREMTDAFRLWLQPRLADGSYFGWLIEKSGTVVAGIGMMILDWPPHPSHPTDARRGYVLNVFVEPEHRRKGLARRLMAEVSAEAQRRGVGYVILHATRQGRAMYETLGWSQTSEMAIQLPPSDD